MATDKQIEANRLNALNSTGPRSAEGKEIARANALKHGLSGAGIVLVQGEAELIKRCEADWQSVLHPANPLETHLAHQIAVEAARIDRIECAERDLRGRLADRAAVCWDDDQRLAAEKLGKTLARDPAIVARQLAQTPQGCDWLLERWESLERALVTLGTWSASQKSLALDLLGTALDLRDLPTKLDPLPGQDATAIGLGVARAESARLRQYRDKLQPLDDGERAAALQGNATTPHPSVALLHRYEAACQRRKAWALKEFRQARRDAESYDPNPAPREFARSPHDSSTPAPYRYEQSASALLHALASPEGRAQLGAPVPTPVVRR